MCSYDRCYGVVRWLAILLYITSSYAHGSYFAILPSTAYSNQAIKVLLVSGNIARNVTIYNIRDKDATQFMVPVAKDNSSHSIVPLAWYQNSSDPLELEFLTANELYGFRGSIKLRYQPKVLIQMSQRVYSPGDFVKYRILLTDPQYIPLPAGVRCFDATIVFDDGLNEISQSVRLDAEEIHSGEYLLGHKLQLGQWTFGVKIGDQTTKTYFQVLEKTAPIHEISIITSKDFITVNEGTVKLNVSARYTFGEPMKGMLYLTLSGDNQKYWQQNSSIDGTKEFDIPIGQLVNLEDKSKNVRELSVNATIKTTNQLTERFHYYSTVIPIYTIPHNLSLHKLVTFEYGNNVTFLVKLTKPNGKPLSKKSPIVSLKAESEETGPITSFDVAIDQLGTAVVSVKAPEGAQSVTFTATYKNATATLNVEQNNDPDLHVRLVPNGDRREISVTSSVAVNNTIIMYQTFKERNNFIFYQNKTAKTHHHISDKKLSVNSIVGHIHVFAMNSDSVVYTSVLFANNLPKVEKLQFELHTLPEGNYTLTVTASPNERVGIAVYEGALDEKLIKKDIELMFSCPVDPQDDYMSVASYDVYNVASQSIGHHIPSTVGLAPMIFWNASSNSNNFTFNVPLHVKTWTVAAFAYSEHGGLRIAVPQTKRRESPVEVYIHVPYSVTGLETVPVDVYIVNKHNHTSVLVLHLLNSANEFIFVNNSGRMDAESKTVYGTLNPYEVQRAEFVIRPKKLGTIKVTACVEVIFPSGAYSYASTVLRVEPETILVSDTIIRHVIVRNGELSLPKIQIPIPPSAEPGTENVSIKLNRNRPKTQNLPQNMLLDTLAESLDPYTMAMRAALVHEAIVKGRMKWPERMAMARKMIDTSIANIEALANADGSFNIADDRTTSSTCRDTLTAVQALIFAKKAKYTPAQGGVLEKALDWLKLQQSEKGSLCATGDGDEVLSIELTAHALLMFLKLDTISWKYESVMKSATKYLISSWNKLSDPYHLALAGYALQSANSRNIETPNGYNIKLTLFDLVMTLTDTKLNNAAKTRQWWKSTVASDLEATAYALLLWIERDNFVDSEPTFNWLRQQHYRLGAANSTSPNSHVALRALIAYADKTIFQQHIFNWRLEAIISDIKTPVEMNFEYDDDTNQVIQLPPKTRLVNIVGKGTFTGFFYITYSYSIPSVSREQQFTIKVTKFTSSTENYEDWQVCLAFNPKLYTDGTRLVQCEISFPTGYIADDDSVDLLRDHYQHVTNTKKNDDTVLVIVFETISIQPECFNVTGFRRTKAVRQLPGMIKVYDRTDPDKFGFQSFDTVE